VPPDVDDRAAHVIGGLEDLGGVIPTQTAAEELESQRDGAQDLHGPVVDQEREAFGAVTITRLRLRHC
jgi:hypothetical protein